MIASDIAERISAVIFGASRCRGFALVMFYDADETCPPDTYRSEAIIQSGDPVAAADMLNNTAEDYYRSVSDCWHG